MVKAHWKLEALIPTVVGVFETDTNPAHFYSKHLHIWFPFVVVLINIPLIHMTCCWFTGTMNAATLIRMHVFAERKTAHQPQLKRATEQQSAQSSESWVYILIIIQFKHQSQGRSAHTSTEKPSDLQLLSCGGSGWALVFVRVSSTVIFGPVTRSAGGQCPGFDPICQFKLDLGNLWL